MKRSDAEEKIRDILSDRLYTYVDYSLVSLLFNELERLGMSPPEYLPEPEYCEVTGKQLECKPIRKWEKE